jgi:glycosyltransferase involved in cell wall biosynthesis
LGQPGFDLIHAHDWLVSFAAIGLKEGLQLPLLATVHATEFGRSQGRLDSPLSRSINEAEWRLVVEAWRVVVCSNFMATELIGSLGAPPDKVDVIPNGVRVDRFQSLKGVDHSLLRARFALPHERIVFNVGRMVREKGLHVLVEAMPLVLAQAPDAKLVVAGKPDSWGYWSWAHGRAEELGMGAKCYFAGFLPDDERDVLLALADVAVFPSLYEPFGIVAPEAMAAGAPVVASSAGGLSEVVIHRLTGLTAYPDNPASLAWAIVETLRNPVEAQARARSAYRRVVREYDWGRIAHATQEIYGQVLSERVASGM